MRREERPIVVCGPARSGTTAIQGMLGAHPEIAICREVPLGRLRSLKPLLEEIAEHQGDQWDDERAAQVVRALWFAAARPSPARPGARRWGMKTPWSELDAKFWASFVSPVYVYALRRGDRVFQSHLSLGWSNGRPEELIERYKRSLRAFERLRASGSAQIVQLDLAESASGRRRVAEEVFGFLGEEASEDMLRLIAGYEERVNQPTSKPGQEPKLPDEWEELLAGDAEYQEMMAAHGY